MSDLPVIAERVSADRAVDRAAARAQLVDFVSRARAAAGGMSGAQRRAVQDLADSAEALAEEIERMAVDRARLLAARRPGRRPPIRAPRMEMLDG